MDIQVAVVVVGTHIAVAVVDSRVVVEGIRQVFQNMQVEVQPFSIFTSAGT